MDDLDFVVKMYNAGENPKKRGPMVDFKIPAKDILKSSQESCGFCTLLVKLDGHGTLPADDDKTKVLRLQAFWPEKVNGSMLPMILEVGLHPDISGGGEVYPLTFFDERDQRPPTRLLELSNLPDQGRVYLVESAVVTNGQYAVLSYVWGTSNTLRLEEAIQSKFQGGFAVDELPDTIQDAVMVTNSLGIGYLWVDSLCILQDSDTDKSREIPRMNDYYRNAHIVISASGARDVHSGFVPEQMSYGDLYAELQHPDPNRQSLTWPVPLRIPGHFPDHSSSLLVDALPQLYTYKGEPINNRAWTLQESVLPRRLLRFPTTGGLSMRCLEGEILAGEIVSDPYHEEPNFISLGLVSSNRHTGDELFELWTKMVEDYTQRSLSYRGDILIAIGALAREFHTKNGVLLGKYLGGFWEHHLRSGLLWHNTVDISKSWSEQQSQYLAPSWSWASCPSPISFRNKSEMHLPLGEFANSAMKTRLFTPRWYCKVLNFDVTPRNELDPFGALEAGYLTIQGPLRPPHRQPNDSSPRTERENKSQGCLDLYLVKFGAHVLILDRPLISSEPTETKQQQYFCLGLWYAGRGRARGLIVQQIDEKSFQRLGFAEYPVDDAEFPSSELHKERVIHLV